ncbi:MAG TPA: TonB-dependent receptor [Longimicrobiales bacterium]|nr:TonB-dependent receptor [Longimicrobiales bacterium]
MSARPIPALRAGRLGWLIALLLLALASAARAQEADVLTGRVVDESGKPVAGARVVAISAETEITRSAITDANGRYMINFPDGGGRYLLRVSFLGKADVTRTVLREGDEELLIANIAMTPQAIALDSLTVTARRPPPGRGEAGEQSTVLSQELLNQLPLPDLDPSTLAQLAAGVVSTQLDSLSGRMGFSVAGMSDLLNQVVLDGMILGESGLEVPEEGIRRTQVTTSTFDASRGGFAGGQVSMTSARGNNRMAGALSYSLDNDALQLGSPTTVNAFTRQNLGGSFGGPLVRDRLFYNLSFGLRRNVNHRFALAANDPIAALRAGVAADSVDRFLGALGGYGVPVAAAGRYDQLRDNLSFQLRTDWNVMQRQGQAHTLSLRLNSSTSDEDSTRINALDLAQHGGETEADNRAAALSLNSRFGGNWTSALAASFNESTNQALPYLDMPEGRVRVTSQFEDGTAATQTLVFGGNRNMPTDAYRKSLQLSEDLSFLLPVGAQLHRLKLGGMLQKGRSVDRSTDNLLGSFTFNSLEDFEANRPARFDRTLAPRDQRMGTVSGGLYAGDTWRISEPLEITAGLRWDYSRLTEKPAYNPAVEQAFGRRTDIEPVATSVSPRIGFNYRIASGGGVRSARTLSGGVGLFAGQAPTRLFAAASRQTGLADAEQRLVCIGEATPVPDWSLFLSDPAAIPDRCLDGSAGAGDPRSLRAPTVTLIDPDQKLPASLRAEIGYRAPLPLNMSANVRYSISRGMGLWGFYDVNFDASRRFTLGTERRPFFGEPGDVVAATGQTTLAGSRIHPQFGNVWDVRADRASVAHQVTAQLGGLLPKGITLSANYTIGFARDQGSGFMPPPTAGDPNVREWAAADNDRRHTLNLTVAKAITPAVELTALARLSSGSPFTPLVGGDINGDGALNDRAFVFEPAAAGDTAVAHGMERLLGVLPGRVASCLEEQLGRIAGRNSCRAPWSRSLSMRLALRPDLPRVERRLTVSVDASNVLEGLDQLVHGADHLKGWGDTPRPDPRLLDVRGFDPATNAFVYRVNEGFGQNRRGPSSIRSPFALRINARLAIGGQPFLTNRAFGTAPRLAGGPGGFGGRGRFGGDDGPGGFGGGGRGGFLAGGAGELMGLLRAAGEEANADSIAARAFTNPLVAIVALQDSLRLTPEQAARLAALSDSLAARLDVHRDSLRRALAGIDVAVLRVGRGGASAGPPGPPIERSPEGDGGRRAFGGVDRAALERAQRAVAPALDAARKDIARALQAARQAVTPEQWAKVPLGLRVASGAAGAADGGGRRGGFNAVGLIDRMLANPLPVLLQLRDTLGLSAGQVAKIQAVSDRLGEKLAKRREELGKKFDSVAGADVGRIFVEVQPTIQSTRQEVADALSAVQKVMTPEQWQKVPEEVKNPFRRGGGRRGA